MDRSMEPNISTDVMPTAITSSAALSRSMPATFIRPRKFACIALKRIARRMMDARLM